jgi:signal transduction histidine kinase
MKHELLWHIAPGRAYAVAAVTMVLALVALTWLEPQGQDVAPLLMIVVGVLIFTFLTRLPTGEWSRRLLLETLNLLGSALLAALGCGVFLLLEPVNAVNLLTDPTITLSFGVLGAFSHSAVRIFARPYAVWAKMRRRRLVWEITHAQLRLVLLAMLVLFGLLMVLNFANNPYLSSSPPAALATALTLLIAVGGFFGILTGVLLFVVVIPASVISYLTARQITRRLDALIQVTHTVRETDTSARAVIEGEDEIAHLGADFNAMLDRLDAARRDLEAERDTVRDLLESRRRLFANVSHELRTPVATIRAYIDALHAPDAHPNDVAIIERELLRLQRLIDDVFTLARVDVDGLQYTMKPLEVGAVLERTTATVRHQAWNAKKIEIVLDYQPQLPLVLADEERVEQVLYNLLRNAVRHTPPGGLIRVSACAERDAVRIEVQDTGGGIAPHDLPHIWERFYRSADARARDADGSGLGLALVKGMVEAMGGTVDVESEPGRGSCFAVSLRRAG